MTSDTNTAMCILRSKRAESYSCGAGETVERPAIDPIDYLYESAVVAQ